MTKKILSCSVLIGMLAVSLLNSSAYSQAKLAQTGFQFLSVGTDARATAMGEAFTTIEGSSVSLFYNPAGMARIPSFLDLTISQHKWIVDITYLSGSIALNYANGRYGVFGLSFLSVDYGEFLGTVVDQFSEQGFKDTGTFSPSAYMVGLGYAKELTDRFSVGGQVKYVVQSTGSFGMSVEWTDTDVITQKQEYSLDVSAFDFGTLYKTGFKSLLFGMSVRNFSEEVKFEKESFQLPLTFKIGVSMDVFDFFTNIPEGHSLLIVMDAAHPRSYPEYINWGGEYLFMDMFALRAGYVSNQDEYGLTYGFGMQKFGLAFDYAYTPFGVFHGVHRFTIRFSK